MQAACREEARKWINWERVGNGRIALWHRPRKIELHRLASEGATVVYTLQSERELAKEVGAIVRTTLPPMRWIWLPLDGANAAYLSRKDVQIR